MRMNNRWSAVLLTVPVIFTALGLLSGCDPAAVTAADPSAASAQQPAADGTADSSAPGYTISWTMHQNLPVPEDAAVVREVEQKFGVDLDIWNLENNKYESLLELKLVQGAIPDLFRIRQTQDLLKYQQQGLLAEIPQEVLDTYAPNIMKAIRENAPAYQDSGIINGAYYGIPVVNPTNIYRIPVVYRQDWLDKLGLSVPDTLADFEKVIYAFANRDPDGNGVKDTYGLSLEGMNVVFGAFGQIVFADQLYFSRQDQLLVIGALQPEMKEALRYLRKWYQDGVIDPEFITGENKGGYKHLSHAFINGRIGMTSMGNYYHWIQNGDYSTWTTDELGKTVETPVAATFNVKELTAKNPQARIVFGRPVSGPDGKRGSKAYDMLMSFTAIGADALKEPGKLETILQILDYVSANPDPQEDTAMKFGIQGEHWEWADSLNKEVVVLPPYDQTFSYQNTIGAGLGMTVPVMPGDRREQWAATLDLDRDGIYNALEVATPSMVKNGPELIQLRNEAYIAFITGERPLEEFDSFVKEFMAAGGAEVLREANEATIKPYTQP
ncbi:putative aldouronate transport system substrate-binding protein [Paenibacillus sp. PastF-1]|nr:putative aldouronate transport system substrate-binding protein [Paenibacillus sp. PastF-2]MDF9846408.1 putative aldouronate transport system substrate-binding protein [Paenibacillus sp. PastM-2]MDF9853243.1 putative aldouronate transport system substrate-binding protein [Paenibacillus sp. PastF-1]MDH6478253.1 putative aldouronate transport system substrate-binding protein [Paenibacillus sp. PastH-2]MDH6506248.1 putative aldouronate transport system substrate-binding protein [Paenibacillus s